MNKRRLFAAIAVAVFALTASCAKKSKPLRAPDVPYAPSPPHVVDRMLRLGKVGPADRVYDLGCGDGRIVIAAVKQFGARGVCVDIDPQRIREARANAKAAGVEDRITFLNQDLFEADISDASVIMLFLWPEVNIRLRPKLHRDLKPGTRVVSYMHDMDDWTPERLATVIVDGESYSIYLWVIPQPRK
jgi:SAM-dependent methyltransferase